MENDGARGSAATLAAELSRYTTRTDLNQSAPVAELEHWTDRRGLTM
jgi:hypothetical protein